MTDHVVAETDELAEGDRMVVEVDGMEIGVFNINGEYRSFVNWCPHQSGPCCEGSVQGRIDASWDPDTLETTLSYSKEGEILSCPWHGWEFDLVSGDCLSDDSVHLPSFPVTVVDDQIIVST